MGTLSIEELAIEAEVDAPYVHRLIELGALAPRTVPQSYATSDVRRVQLLRSWEDAGFPVESLVKLLREGEISVSWLDAPVMTRAPREEVTYEELSRQEDVSLTLVQAVQEALGFASPDPHERIREGDRELVALIGMLLAAGATQTSALGVIRVHADGLRRIAKAQAELYESEIEQPLRRSGSSEQQLLDYGAEFGDRAIDYIERVVLGIFRRHREHVWIEHRIAHAEVALERAGIQPRIPRPPTICFVDLTGYTRITEERGDEIAARLASNLASLVERISLRHGGRPIRWLGDGGMFHFKEPGAAVLASLDMVESAPRLALPPMHIGVHTGPVILQDGDVYGRTVNLASRIASFATAGQVLASDETVVRCPDARVHFDLIGPVEFKGVSRPVMLHRAARIPTRDPGSAQMHAHT